MRGLTAVPLNRVLERQGLEIVHVPRVHAESPERHRPKFVSRVFRRILDYAVTRTNVMEQEIAIGMNNLVSQSIWYGKGFRR